MPAFVTHLESTFDGSSHPSDRPQQVHENKPFLVRYDLEAVKRFSELKEGDIHGSAEHG